MHKLDENTLITPTLLRRFHAEAEAEGGDGRYGAIIMRSNGDILTHALGPSANPLETSFATEILKYLNRELHHDGAWCIVFTHYVPPPLFTLVDGGSYARFVILWMDKDGDVQFPIEHQEGLAHAINMGPIAWLQQCESAWGLWHKAMVQVLDPKPEQLYRRALGELPPSTVH